MQAKPAQDGSSAHAVPHKERGAVLLIAVCILALLSLFATAFVRLVNFERRASTNYLDSVRARLVARAGIQEAVVRLKLVAQQQNVTSSTASDKWAYKLTPPAVSLTALDLDLNLLTTTTPSFLKTSIPAEYGTFKMFDSPIAVSGTLGQTYNDGVDAYKLKVLDGASQINLNHPDELAAKRMLSTLLRVSSVYESGWDLTQAQADTIANHVIDNRPEEGFQSKAEIRTLITAELGLGDDRVTEDRWQHGLVGAAFLNTIRPPLRDMVTVYSWTDEKVIRPWRLNNDGKRALTLQGRAPVNLNTASLPVLAALFAGLRARNSYGTFEVGLAAGCHIGAAVWNRARTKPFKTWHEFERWLDSAPAVKSFSAPGANPSFGSMTGTNINVAYQYSPNSYAADASGNPTFGPLGLVPNDNTNPGVSDVSPTWLALRDGQAIRDLIKAQLNPNTMLTKFGQGINHGGSRLGTNGQAIPMPRLVDKADIIQETTEGCFDSMGVFEITSLGLVLQKDPEVAAAMGLPGNDEAIVRAANTQQVVTRICDVVRLTSQSDFERYRALFASGDFIPDYRHWMNQLGFNRLPEGWTGETGDGTHPPIKDLLGWPGMVTHPTYSMVRDDTTLRGMESRYVPAQYDGALTLTNMVGTELWKHDFAAGFSAGSLMANKARAWWEPKDQNPFVVGVGASGVGTGANNGTQIIKEMPTRPFGAYPKRDLEGNIVDSGGITDVDSWYENSDGETRENAVGVQWDDTTHLLNTSATDRWPFRPDFTDLRKLVYPAGSAPGSPGKTPRVSGLESTPVRDPFDAVPGQAATATDVPTGAPASGTYAGMFWHQGSSLWNNGVALGRYRNRNKISASGNSEQLSNLGPPRVLAYDSDNWQLVMGSSVRFWVQPLVDPFLYQEEVLFSFAGSRDPSPGGNRRQTGLRVVKRVEGVAGVSVVLQAIPSPETNANPSNLTVNDTLEGGVSQHWHQRDGYGGIWKDETVIHVDYFFNAIAGQTYGGTVTGPFAGGSESPAVDPFNPSWLPNSWHWVVINYGATGRAEEFGEGTHETNPALYLPQVDVSLQVDLNPTQPPKGFNTNESDLGRLGFKGEMGITDGYGELHGYETTRNVGHGWDLIDTFLGEHTWDSTDGDSTADNQQGAAPTNPTSLPRGANELNRIGINDDWWVIMWQRQKLLGDFYHCDLTETSVSLQDADPAWHNNAVVYSGTPPWGQYIVTSAATNWLKTIFPAVSTNRRMWLRFRDPANGNQVNSFPQSNGNAGITGLMPVSYNYHGSADNVPPWTINWNDAMFGRDYSQGMDPDPEEGDPTPHEWAIDIRVQWSKLRRAPNSGCKCCHAQQSSPGTGPWTGAAMNYADQYKNNWSASANTMSGYKGGQPFPNGCYHDSEQMWVHGWQPAFDDSPAQGSGVIPCWTVFKSRMAGHNTSPGAQSNRGGGMPGPDPLPADAVCDDCHGCESCDVDGPMFLGGEPNGNRNYAAGGELADVNPTTVASAVFDNFVIKNSLIKRTDYVPTTAGEQPDWFEDRFFSTNMAARYIESSGQSPGVDESGNPLPPPYTQALDSNDTYGAVFRRGFLELLGTRATLGTLTFTTYPSTDRGLSYELMLWKLPGETSGSPPIWRPENTEIASGTPNWRLGAPGQLRYPVVTAGGAPAEDRDLSDAHYGFQFSGGSSSTTLYDGLGNSTRGPDILMFGVRLRQSLSGSSLNDPRTFNTTGSTVVVSGGGLPVPIFETPVVEDLTLTLIRETPQLLYAEEGVTE